MCYQFTSYQFEETLRAFIKTNLDFADQGKRRSQRLDSRNRPKINSGNWSLVVIQKFFLLKKRTSQESYCHDKWEGLYQTDHSTYVT
jgi:hypothetical protein